MDPLKVGLAISVPELAAEARAALKAQNALIVFEEPATRRALDEAERTRPDVVVLAACDGPCIARMRRLASAPRVVVVGDSLLPESILAAMRAGAGEYVVPPVGAGLSAALERLARERHEKARGAGQAFGFVSVKGGCGATTLACHVAVEMQREGAGKVLLADFDLSCGLIRFLMRCEGPYSVADALLTAGELDASYWRGLVTEKAPGLDVVAAPSEDCVEKARDPGEMGRVLRFAKTQYRWTVADLGRGLGATAVNIERELDALVIVTTLDIGALNRARVVVRGLLDAGVDRGKLRLVLNRAPSRTDLQPTEIEKAIGIPVFDTAPERAAALDAAYTDGRLLLPGDPLRARCGRIAERLTGRERQPKPRSLFGLIPIAR